MTTIKTDYNGWKNRATWNIALWINNDYNLYETAVYFVKHNSRINVNRLYINFVQYAGLRGERTPDRFAYDGSQLDYKSLGAMLKELAN